MTMTQISYQFEQLASGIEIVTRNCLKRLFFFLLKQPGISINWDNYWSPKIFVENSVGDPKVTQSRMLDFNENGEAWVIDRRRVKGVFMEQLELWEFPFDVQVGSEEQGTLNTVLLNNVNISVSIRYLGF